MQISGVFLFLGFEISAALPQALPHCVGHVDFASNQFLIANTPSHPHNSLNASEALKRLSEKRSKIALRLKDAELAHLAFVPGPLVAEFEQSLYGRRHRTAKLPSYWKRVKDILCALKLEPHAWADNKERFYDFFSENQFSVSYCQKLINIINRWGVFYSKKTQSFFEELPYPTSHERERIADSNYGSQGTGNKEPMPLSPGMLESKRSCLRPEHYNWLYGCVWLGLRPSEVDSLIDPRYFRIEKHGPLAVISVYQGKLTAIDREKRWKSIPCFLPEMVEAINVIQCSKFNRPLAKSMRGWFSEKYGLYAGRKGFVDLMLSKGQALEDISLWMGHTNVQRTWVGLTRFGGHPRSVLYGVHNAGQQGKEKSSQELYG